MKSNPYRPRRRRANKLPSRIEQSPPSTIGTSPASSTSLVASARSDEYSRRAVGLSRPVSGSRVRIVRRWRHSPSSTSTDGIGETGSKECARKAFHAAREESEYRRRLDDRVARHRSSLPQWIPTKEPSRRAVRGQATGANTDAVVTDRRCNRVGNLLRARRAQNVSGSLPRRSPSVNRRKAPKMRR